MVKQPVQDSRSHDTVSQDFSPTAEILVAVHNHAPGFVAFADQPKKKLRGIPVQLTVSDFIQDQQIGSQVDLPPVFQLACSFRFLQVPN